MSWGIALGFAGLVYFYYTSLNKPQVNKTRAASFSSATQPPVKPAKKREENRAKPKTQTGASSGIEVPSLNALTGNGDSSTSGVETGKKGRKGAKKQQTTQSAAPVAAVKAAVKSVISGSAPEEDDQAEVDRAWAQNLAALKKGTSLAPPSRTDSRNRTVKQSSANFSSASSNAADADDDLTPALSPALAAGGVSDMLEPASSGPSVLRLTESSKPVKAQQQRQQTTETAESKKQRQNRQKVEERRIQREAEEKERQVLLENQRRTAREARGEPARNGIAPAKAPTASEWAVRAATRATQPPAETVTSSNTANGGLLDTFSEEDQMTMAKKLSEDESGWNTVPKGKKKQKKASDFIESNESEAAPIAPTPAPVAAPTPAPVSKPVETRSNGFPSSFDTSSYDAGSHPEDSQWSA